MSLADPEDTERDLPGLPFALVDAWLRQALPAMPVSAGWRAEVISGGLSNITYRIWLADGTRLILRRPPLGGVLPSAHDMQREYRVLSALQQTPVPVPLPLAMCTDPDVLGYPFYVMDDVPGYVLRNRADTARLAPAQRAAVADDLIVHLAELHAVDFAAIGLSEFGRPDGYTHRQVRRWRQQWLAIGARRLADMELLLSRLADRVPPRAEATVVHGDYRLDNTIIGAGHTRIAAVIDWELSTLGDPLTDLGMLLTYWHDLGDIEREAIPVAAGLTAHEGFPRSEQVAERYSRLTGRDLSGLPFYRALGCMKLAVILEGVRARHSGGHTVSDGYDGGVDPVPALVASGLRFLS
jgi:aminoglycoside phosphotransferase (APT) family kinase protein